MGLIVAATVAVVKVVGWLLMTEVFWGRVIGSGLGCRRKVNASMRSLISGSSSEYSIPEVFGDLDSWSEVTGDELMLGFGVAH